MTFGHFGPLPVYYLTYTWSETWRVKNGMDAGQALANLLCTMGGPAAAACAVVVNYFAGDLRNNVDYALAHRRCLRIRESIYPSPAAGSAAYATTTVTCTSYA